MIGQLCGRILIKQPPILLVDVQGVGYEVNAPMSTFVRLPKIGQDVVLHTHLIVREDAHLLYGFFTEEERQLFRILLKVNGVGPRMALTILSRMNPDEFVGCVARNDTDSLVTLPGVGQKTASRLIIEMRDRLKDWQGITTQAALPVEASDIASTRHALLQDAVSALVALGYKAQEAVRMIARADDGVLGSEDLIRCALREGMA